MTPNPNDPVPQQPTHKAKAKAPERVSPCKNLSAGATLKERKARHQAKMKFKEQRRANWHKQRHTKQGKISVFANLSSRHPNAGKHPSEAYA